MLILLLSSSKRAKWAEEAILHSERLDGITAPHHQPLVVGGPT
jgi:hypothetical protein